MLSDFVCKEDVALGEQVLAAWREQGIGVPGAKADGRTLVLPVFRHGESSEPLVVKLGRSPFTRNEFRASVKDAEVLEAIASRGAYDAIVCADDELAVEHPSPEDSDPMSYYCSGSTIESFGHAVWLLHLFSQRLLDYAEGVKVGTPLIRPDLGLVKPIMGIETKQ